MRKWVRRVGVLLVVVGLLVGAAVGVAWGLFRLYGPEVIRAELERALSSAFGRPARVGTVAFRPWGAHLRATGVSVAEDDSAGLVLFSLDYADVGIRLESLWRRQIVLTIGLTGLDATTSAAGGEGGGLAALVVPSTFTIGSVEVRVGLIRLDRGHILHRDAVGGWALEARGIAAEGRPEPPVLRLTARAESLRIESPGGEEQLERLRVEGALQPGEIRLEPSLLSWQGHEIRLSGRLTQPVGSTELHMTLRGELPLAAVGRRAGLTVGVSGRATVEAVLDGPLAAPRVDARVTVPELAAGPVRVRNVQLEGHIVDASLQVSDLRADLPTGTVTGTLTIHPETTRGAHRAELTLDGLHLPQRLTALGPGTVRASARRVGPTIELGPTTARWAGVRLDLSGRFEPGRPLALHADLDADLGGLGRALGSASVDGRVRVAADEAGTWERPLVTGRIETESLVVGTQRIGRAALMTRLEGTDGFARWAGTLGAERIASPAASVENVQAAFTLDADQLALQRLTARVRGIPLALRGMWQWGGTGQGEADLGPVALDGLREIPAEWALAGTGSGRVQIAVGARTVVTADVGLTDVSLQHVGLGTGQLQATLNGRDLTADLGFPSVRLSASARGRVEAGQTLALQARIERFDLEPLIARFAPAARPHVRAAVSARAEAELPLDRPDTARVTAWITPDDLAIAGESWTTRSAAVVRWDGERLSLESLQVRGPRGTLGVDGVADRRGDGRLALALDDARLPPPLDRLGRGAVRGEARLTRAALEGVSIRARWPTWALTVEGRLPFDAPVALRSQLTGDLAEVGRIQGLDAITGQAVVAADISGPWRTPLASGRIEVPTLTVAGQALARVSVPFRLTPTTLRIDHATALIGSDPVTLDGGATAADRSWRGQGTLVAPAVTIQAWSIQSPRIAFTVDAERLAVTDLALSIQGIPVRGTASWPWTGPGRLDGRLGPAPLAGLPGVPTAWALDGTVSGRVEATGRSLDDVNGLATLELGQVRAGSISLGAGTLDLDLRGRTARADLRFPERRVTATAERRAAADANVSVRGTVDDLALGELLRRLGFETASPIEATLSARLQAEVPLARPTAARGTLRVDRLQGIVAGEALASREPIIAAFDESGIRVDGFALQGAAGSITGHLSVMPGGQLDASLRGQTPLAFLASLRPEVEEASGTLDVAATVTGTTAAPVISGTGTVRGGTVRVAGYADPIRELELQVTASTAGLRLTKAQGSLGGGTLTATGEAALAGRELGAYRVALTARRISVSPIDGLAALWDGDLELTGRGARRHLGGELRLLRGTYARELAPAAGGRSPVADATERPGLPLRVFVKLDDNLVVRNRTARLRLGGTLSLEGTTAAPAVLGVIETRDGTVAFRNRRFTVVSGTARFLDPRRIDPFLDATATARVRDYDVTARVSGRLDSLEVTLRSSPPLAQEDLLALVAFGATRAELERSPAGVIALEATTTLVRDLLGLETLDGDSQGPLGRLQVGTVVPERPSTPDSMAPEARNNQRVRVEYQLVGPLSLVGEQGQRGGYAAGVVVRLRFR